MAQEAEPQLPPGAGSPSGPCVQTEELSFQGPWAPGFPSRFRRPLSALRHGYSTPNEEQTPLSVGPSEGPSLPSPLGRPRSWCPETTTARRPLRQECVRIGGRGGPHQTHAAPGGSPSASVLPGPGGWAGRGGRLEAAGGGVPGPAGRGRRWKPLPGTAASAARPRNSALNNL